MLDLLPPRRFCDFTAPLREDGSVMTEWLNFLDNRRYVGWLARYLYGAEIPLTPEEEEWIRAENESPKSVIFSISFCYGYNLLWLEEVEAAFEKGATYESYIQEARKLWLERFPDLEAQTENPFKCSYGLSGETFCRLFREWQEWQASGEECNHSDIPFRPLIAHLIKQIPSADLRIRAVDDYLTYVNELYSESVSASEMRKT